MNKRRGRKVCSLSKKEKGIRRRMVGEWMRMRNIRGKQMMMKKQRAEGTEMRIEKKDTKEEIWDAALEDKGESTWYKVEGNRITDSLKEKEIQEEERKGSEGREEAHDKWNKLRTRYQRVIDIRSTLRDRKKDAEVRQGRIQGRMNLIREKQERLNTTEAELDEEERKTDREWETLWRRIHIRGTTKGGEADETEEREQD